MTTPWQRRYSQRMQLARSSAIREILKLTQLPGIISFAGGLPAPELFPVERCREAMNRVLTDHSAQALQYSTTEGYLPLREWIVAKMAQYGVAASPDNILITTGAQQALDLIGKVLLDPGDLVLTEEPTYLGAVQAWRAYQAGFISVPIDEHGICVDDRLAAALHHNPKFMYILPNFQNPGGVTLSLDRRQRLVAIADEFGIPIVEDDPYGELRYEGEHLPPLIALDADLQDQRIRPNQDHSFFRGDVIYLGTFSKTFAPGLRLGWMVAPTAVIRKMVTAKQGVDLHTSTFAQMVIHDIARDGFLDEHKQLIRRVYRERRDVMLAAMDKHFPPPVRWTRPQGGLFLWVTLPEALDAADLLEEAIAQQVAFVPGQPFHPSDDPWVGHNTLRLNFSNAQPEQIEIGIERLGRVLAQAIERLDKTELEPTAELALA